MQCNEKQRELTKYPCDQCGAQCQNISDLGRHRTTYHQLGTLSTENQQERFWCDVCPLKFESQVQLQFHTRGFHVKHF